MLPSAMPADVAAVKIVDGLTRRARKIFVPWYAHLLYFMQRLWPEFGHKGVVHSMEKFRAQRDESVDQN